MDTKGYVVYRPLPNFNYRLNGLNIEDQNDELRLDWSPEEA